MVFIHVIVHVRNNNNNYVDQCGFYALSSVAGERVLVLAYLDEWERSVNGRPGFDAADKKQMLLSQETLLGLQITG